MHVPGNRSILLSTKKTNYMYANIDGVITPIDWTINPNA
jgi:hypothetical protein